MNNITQNVNYATYAGIETEEIQQEIKKLDQKEIDKKIKQIRDSYIKYSENVLELYKQYHKKELYDLVSTIQIDLNIINKLN